MGQPAHHSLRRPLRPRHHLSRCCPCRQFCLAPCLVAATVPPKQCAIHCWHRHSLLRPCYCPLPDVLQCPSGALKCCSAVYEAANPSDDCCSASACAPPPASSLDVLPAKAVGTPAPAPVPAPAPAPTPEPGAAGSLAGIIPGDGSATLLGTAAQGGSSSAAGGAAASTSSSSGGGAPVAAIVGGVLGGLAALGECCACITATWGWVRSNRFL